MSRRFLRQTVSLGVSYTLGTFNDNFFKQAILLLAVGMGHTAVQAWGTVLFSLPFVLFSAWAGWLADRYAKCRLVLAAKALEVCAMLAGGWGLLQLHWSGMLAMLFCMGASATLFSPALNGSLPELFAREDVPRVNALFKLTTTASILLGITLAGGALERQWLATEIPFGRWLVAAVAVGVAVLGLLSVFFIPCRPAAARREELPPFPWLGALDSARELWRLRARKGIFGCLCADAFFYTLSTLVLLEINAYGVAQLGLGPTLASLLPGGLMLGICAGAGLAARRARADWRRSAPVPVSACCWRSPVVCPPRPGPSVSACSLPAMRRWASAAACTSCRCPARSSCFRQRRKRAASSVPAISFPFPAWPWPGRSTPCCPSCRLPRPTCCWAALP